MHRKNRFLGGLAAALLLLPGLALAAPVASTFTGTGQSASYVPAVDNRSTNTGLFNVSVWGTFVATVQLERSLDNGVTWLPVTAGGTQMFVWTAPASESNQEPEPGVIYRLNCTAYTSGTVNYRVSP